MIEALICLQLHNIIVHHQSMLLASSIFLSHRAFPEDPSVSWLHRSFRLNFPKKTSPRVGVEGWGTTSTVCTEAVTTARCPAWPPNCRLSSLWALNLSLNPPNILPSGLSAPKYSNHWALSPKHFLAFGHSTTQYFLAKQSTFQIFWTLGVWPKILKVLKI